MTLRDLLIQRSARLQDYPAFTAPPWGELRYPAFRNRVEGIGLGLFGLGLDSLDSLHSLHSLHSASGSPWDWACEVACACCGLVWDPAGPPADPQLLGGDRFNLEEGRQAYHDRDHDLAESTLFTPGLTHGEVTTRLRRLNGKLGWDHTTAVELPLAGLGEPAVRAALWSALYGGSHAILVPGQVRGWDPAPFSTFWSRL